MRNGKVALIGLGVAALVLALSIGLVSAQETPNTGDTGGAGTTPTTHCTANIEDMREHMDAVHGAGSYDAIMGQGNGGYMRGGSGTGYDAMMGQGNGGHMGGGNGTGFGGMMGQGNGGYMRGGSGMGSGGMMGW